MKWSAMQAAKKLLRRCYPAAEAQDGASLCAPRLRFRNQQGATMVEFAIASSILFAMLFGIIELGMALYCYTFVSEAARDATRFAAVRGQLSCGTDVTSDSYCDLGPTAVGSSQTTYSTQPLQTWVQGLGLPFASGMQVTATWWSPSSDANGHTVWTTACTTQTDNNSGTLFEAGATQCNYPGHSVTVTVSYPVPLAIPFVMKSSVTVQATSSMVINE